MEYPRLTPPAATRQIMDTFGGYNRNLRIGDGEFFHMENMSSDHYPVLSPRKPRGLHATGGKPEAMVYKHELFYIDNGRIHYGGRDFPGGLEEQPEGHTMVSMGANVVVLPEGKWFNSARFMPDAGDVPDAEKSNNCNAFWNMEEWITAQFQPCQANGEVYPADRMTTGPTPPEDPTPGDTWLDTGGEMPVLKQWVENGDAGLWQSFTSNYVRIQAQGISQDFRQYDGVALEGFTSPEVSFLNGSNVIWDLGDDYIVVQGMMSSPVFQTKESFSVTRQMPKMDFVVECGNRLWGCRYGENAKGQFVNEIYCSKLGDFTNWGCFMGISTDSAAIGLGSDGPFTGAVSYMGHPIFFKENVLHKVYISSAGGHSVVDTPCAGVQPGCEKSLQIVGDTLYYKSNAGIMAYDGSAPVALPSVFGSEQYEAAVAGAYRDKYYLSMRHRDGTYHLFVYDTRRGLWHREDSLAVSAFATGGDKLYAICGRDIRIIAGAESSEEVVEWLVETGPMDITTPDRKYLSRLNVRLSLAAGGEVAVYARYDFSPQWEHLFTTAATDLQSFEIPILPKRCDHMRLRIAGRGEGNIYAFTKTTEQGSDVS